MTRILSFLKNYQKTIHIKVKGFWFLESPPVICLLVEDKRNSCGNHYFNHYHLVIITY